MAEYTKLDAFLIQEDALGNHFEIVMPPFSGVINLPATIIRIKDIEIAGTEINTYIVTKGGKTATRPSGLQATANEFGFTYIPDRAFTVYDGIENFLRLVRNDVNGKATLSDTDARFDMIVLARDSGGNIVNQGWKMRGCWFSAQDSPKFAEDSGDPLEISVTVQFIDKEKLV